MQTEHSSDVGPREGTKYLSFSLASEEYAVDILRVREIRGLCPITPLPNAPAHVRGVMNLRGAVVPVVDLRVAIGLGPSEFGKFNVIIVLQVEHRVIGFVVDSVCDVVALSATDIEATPELGIQVDASLIAGIARVQERFVILLDIDGIVGPDVEHGTAA